MLMREGESHPIFNDPLFSESQAWILSTSGLSAGDRFYGTGFGTVWPEGYGINCELFSSSFPSMLPVPRVITLTNLFVHSRSRGIQNYQIWYRIENILRRDFDRSL